MFRKLAIISKPIDIKASFKIYVHSEEERQLNFCVNSSGENEDKLIIEGKCMRIKTVP